MAWTASSRLRRPISDPSSRTNPKPFPGDVAAKPVAAAGEYTGSVSREAVKPVDLTASAVTRSSLPTAQPPAAAPAMASAPLDRTTTATVQPAPAVATRPVAEEFAGWSRAAGTQITVKDGETVYNLSRRFGVPANVLLSVNGLSDASALKAGQKIVIPTYVYSRQAPVSAPDSDPNVADARSSRGTKYDVPADKVPVPTKAPTGKAAVLPQQPRSGRSIPPPRMRRRRPTRRSRRPRRVVTRSSPATRCRPSPGRPAFPSPTSRPPTA